MKTQGICTGLMLAVLVVVSVTPVARATPIVAGDDVFHSVGDVTFTIFDPFVPGGFTEEVVLTSQGQPMGIIHRDAQSGNVIDTEIVALQLVGMSGLGPLTVRVGTGNGVLEGASPGQIIDVLQDTLDPGFPTGDPSSFLSGLSSFSIFYEIDTVMGTLYNKTPHTLGPEEIYELPPIKVKYAAPQITPLWLDVGVLGDHSDDLIVGEMGPFHHTPEPATMAMLSMGGMALLRRRRK